MFSVFLCLIVVIDSSKLNGALNVEVNSKDLGNSILMFGICLDGNR